MTDSLKFGPEWLRVLSQESSGTQVASGTGGGVCGGGGGSAPHRYQLAEHRYGREEMLALFDRLTLSRSGPDLLLRSFPTLYVEKPQPPLALVQMTEEEARTWQRGINSESVLRGPGSLRGGGGAGGGMGRGSVSMDRGVRGRGRGGGGYYVRGGLGSYEEESGGDGSSGGPWRRGVDSGTGGGSGNLGGPMTSSSSFNSRVTRSFDRSQGTVSERGWGERNGTVDSNDWNGSTSPRKDFGRGLMENWRARGSTEEEDTWRVTNRTEKWGRNSWREGGSGSIDREQESGRSWESGEGGGSHHRARSGGWEDGSTGHRPNMHRHSWEEPDKLPEWATENLSESGGSFDASGAFHGGGGYSDDDEKGHGKERPDGLRRLTQGLRRNSGSRGGGSDGNRNPMLLRTVSESEADHHPSMVTGPAGAPSRSVSGHMSERSVSSEVGSSPEGSKGSALTTKQDTSIPPPNMSNTSPPTAPITVQSSKSTPPHSPPVPTPDSQSRPDTNRIGPQSKLPDSSQTRASSVPTNTQNQMSLGMVDGSVSSLDARGQQRQRSEEDLERMQEVADDLVAKLMDEEEDEVEIRNSRGSGGVRQPGSKDEVGRDESQVETSRLGAVPGSAPSQDDPTVAMGDKWYYQDPQGIVQGPFGSGEMADWFRAGYFNTTLLVRRACDECFSQLGDLMKLWGRIPFSPGPNPPPLKAPMADPAIAAASAPMPLVTGAPGGQAGSGPGGSIGSVNQAENLLMQQYQYQLIQRQIFMRQQAAVQAIMEKLSIEHQQSFMQQLMAGSQGQQQAQGPQQQQQPNPPQRPPPHHTTPDGMNTFLQPPFKIQSELSGPKNPVMALINQIHQQQQAKVSQSPDGLVGPQVAPSPKLATDPISQLIQHVAMQQQQQQQPPHPSNPGVPHHQPPRPNVDQGRPPSPVSSGPGPGSQQPTPGGKQESDPIQSILRLLEGRSNGNPLVNQPQVEPVWGGPFAVQSWLAQAAAAGGQVGAPPGQLISQGVTPGSGAPLSLWDLQGKDVKTEQQILEEQMRAEEERKKEEIRKQEEAAAKKKVEEEERKRKQLEEELRQKEAERRLLEEQMRQLEEEKRAEEQRRKEEERRMAEERRRLEERLRQEQELKQKLIAEEKKVQEIKRLAELKQKKEEAEERKRKEKEEEARKQLQRELEEEEKQKKKQEEERKRQQQQQQQQQQEETNRRLESQRRLLEAQRKAQETQNAEQTAAIPTSTPPVNQRQTVHKSQAPWAQQQGSTTVQSTSPPIANLAEIQRMQEKEEKEILQQKWAQKMREREAASEKAASLSLAQLQPERELHPQPESPVQTARPASGQQSKPSSGTAIQLKWADKRPQPAGPVKSLAEIQAEEHEQQLARERERAERAAQQVHQPGAPATGGGSQGHSTSSTAPVGGIWGSATQALTWAARSAGHGGWAAAAAVGAFGSQMNHTSSAPTNASQPASTGLSSSSSSSSSNSSNSSPAVWSNAGQNSWATNSVASTVTSGGGGGFWEEVPAPPQPPKLGGKQGGKVAANSPKVTTATAQPAGGKGKGKSRKDEVMKIFEQNVQRSISTGDEFTQWCLKTLGNLQTSVDIPTFVGFLKDIDSPYEVSDYVRNYLGDGKEAREFSRNFLERRSRWRNAQKAAAAPPSEDDMCVPAPAVNPLSSEFQEVKGKGKKAKKNKMMRLDNRILGFSVTASHDRINVGDRDYGEGV